MPSREVRTTIVRRRIGFLFASSPLCLDDAWYMGIPVAVELVLAGTSAPGSPYHEEDALMVATNDRDGTSAIVRFASAFMAEKASQCILICGVQVFPCSSVSD